MEVGQHRVVGLESGVVVEGTDQRRRGVERPLGAGAPRLDQDLVARGDQVGGDGPSGVRVARHTPSGPTRMVGSQCPRRNGPSVSRKLTA